MTGIMSPKVLRRRQRTFAAARLPDRGHRHRMHPLTGIVIRLVSDG